MACCQHYLAYYIDETLKCSNCNIELSDQWRSSNKTYKENTMDTGLKDCKCLSCQNSKSIMDGQELKTGEKKDNGKPRWELLDYSAIEEIVKVLTLGAQKYEARNWELGIHYGRVFGAVQRHLSAWWMGESTDKETGLSHLSHALTELMFLSAYEKRGMKEFDDRPRKT